MRMRTSTSGAMRISSRSAESAFRRAMRSFASKLAVTATSDKRVPAAPDLPTIGETLSGFSVTGWQGLFAPAGTPRPIVMRIAAEVKRLLERPDVAAALRKVGGEPAPMTPEEFA